MGSWAIDSEQKHITPIRGYMLLLRGHEGERNNCFGKIELVDQKSRDETTLTSKTLFSRHYFGLQSRRSSLLVGYNIWRSSSSTNQNAALIIVH